MSFITNYLLDIEVFNVVLFLVGATCLFLLVALIWDEYKNIRTGKKMTAYMALSLAGGFLLSFVSLKAAYENTRRIHWLRVGTSRYTVARINQTFYSRSGRKFAVSYRVGTFQGQDQGECGEGCPPVGSRRYVRFAAEAPDVCELTKQPVPDSVRVIPPLGWSRIP